MVFDWHPGQRRILRFHCFSSGVSICSVKYSSTQFYWSSGSGRQTQLISSRLDDFHCRISSSWRSNGSVRWPVRSSRQHGNFSRSSVPYSSLVMPLQCVKWSEQYSFFSGFFSSNWLERKNTDLLVASHLNCWMNFCSNEIKRIFKGTVTRSDVALLIRRTSDVFFLRQNAKEKNSWGWEEIK